MFFQSDFPVPSATSFMIDEFFDELGYWSFCFSNLIENSYGISAGLIN